MSKKSHVHRKLFPQNQVRDLCLLPGRDLASKRKEYLKRSVPFKFSYWINLLSVKTQIYWGGGQFVSKLQFCWVGGNKWKTRSTVDELRVASEGSCTGSPQRRGTVFTGKWKREISILLPPTPRYLECLYADHRKEVFRFFVCCFSDDLKLYLERFFCGRKMTHSWYLIITL